MQQWMVYACFPFFWWGAWLPVCWLRWNTIELHWTAGCSSAFHCNSTSHNPTKTRRSLPTCQQSVWSDQRWYIQSAWKCLAVHFSNPRGSKRNIQGHIDSKTESLRQLNWESQSGQVLEFEGVHDQSKRAAFQCIISTALLAFCDKPAFWRWRDWSLRVKWKNLASPSACAESLEDEQVPKASQSVQR